MKYLQLLEDGLATVETISGCPPETRLAYLSEWIFEFITYDSAMDELFGRKALEVCQVVSNGTTFDYIKDAENYRWYLMMVNTDFFAGRLEWGTSIRGAWWEQIQELTSCGLFYGDEQVAETLKFNQEEWMQFIAAMTEFVKGE